MTLHELIKINLPDCFSGGNPADLVCLNRFDLLFFDEFDCCFYTFVIDYLDNVDSDRKAVDIDGRLVG